MSKCSVHFCSFSSKFNLLLAGSCVITEQHQTDAGEARSCKCSFADNVIELGGGQNGESGHRVARYQNGIAPASRALNQCSAPVRKVEATFHKDHILSSLLSLLLVPQPRLGVADPQANGGGTWSCSCPLEWALIQSHLGTAHVLSPGSAETNSLFFEFLVVDRMLLALRQGFALLLLDSQRCPSPSTRFWSLLSWKAAPSENNEGDVCVTPRAWLVVMLSAVRYFAPMMTHLLC